MISCHYAWDGWEEIISVMRTKTLWRKEGSIGAALKTMLDREFQVEELNFHVILKSEKCSYTGLLQMQSSSSPSPP